MNSVTLQHTKLIYRNLLHRFLHLITKSFRERVFFFFPFTLASKTIKYLGMNLTKDIKNPYLEKCKIMIKEIEDDTSKWNGIPCSWIG